MAWQDEMVPMLRSIINDPAGTGVYTDERLEETLITASRLVTMELSFPKVYLANQATLTITPDPTVGDDRDENFINLATVRAACVVAQGSALKAAAQSLLVKDGASTVDLREQYKAFIALLGKGWCAVYDTMKEQYVTGQSGLTTGAAIMTPFRMFAGGDDGLFYTGYNRNR